MGYITNIHGTDVEIHSESVTIFDDIEGEIFVDGGKCMEISYELLDRLI